MSRQRAALALIVAIVVGFALTAAFAVHTPYPNVDGLLARKANSAATQTAPDLPVVQNADQATSAPSVVDSATSSSLVANPYGGYDMPAEQLADCQSGKPVIDLEGNPSAAIESATHVYDAYCDLLIGATPSTFVALDYWYGKDNSTVWVLDSPIDEPPAEAEAIVGADPATFTLIPNDNCDNSAMYPNEDFSLAYTKDKQHVYLNGFMTGLNPALFTNPCQ